MTTHKLQFECVLAPGHGGFFKFRVGTCHGTYRPTPLYYEILNIINDQPGNGHLEDVFQFFSRSCRRDGRQLRILEVGNARFLKHLVEKRGFVAHGIDCVKKFY